MTGRGSKTPPRALPVLVDEPERTALQARWPEDVLALSAEERERRVRVGQDSVMLDELVDGVRRTRGFVRAVLTVPLGHPRASVFGVFVELDRASYQALQRAHRSKEPARVWGTLATRLPFLDAALGAEVEILEDGSERRARVVATHDPLLLEGPSVGARAPSPGKGGASS